MWKWTQINHLKTIILDGSILNEDYLHFPYQQYVENVQVFVILRDNERYILSYNQKSYDDLLSLLKDILSIASCASYETICISRYMPLLEKMMTYHIGTVLARPIRDYELRNIPDFVGCTLETLPDILTGKKKGYGAEVYAFEKHMGDLLRCQKDIVLDNGNIRQLHIYAGGRYYPEGHHYLLDDPLSMTIRTFKHRYIDVVGNFFDEAIELLRREYRILQHVTYIPPKPKDIQSHRFNRFESLDLPTTGLPIENILVCQKDFSQKGNDLQMRKETVKGVFEVTGDVKDQYVVLIDDVYSSGSTVTEAAKMLYQAGAYQVIVLVIAISQMNESPLQYNHLVCSQCGSPMELVYQYKKHRFFFGCTNYQNHPQQKSILSLRLGLFCLKQKNEI